MAYWGLGMDSNIILDIFWSFQISTKLGTLDTLYRINTFKIPRNPKWFQKQILLQIWGSQTLMSLEIVCTALFGNVELAILKCGNFKILKFVLSNWIAEIAKWILGISNYLALWSFGFETLKIWDFEILKLWNFETLKLRNVYFWHT